MGQVAIDDLVQEGVAIVYDGDCPLCRSYALRQRLVPGLGTPKLVNARSNPALCKALAARGIDLDQGMVVAMNGTLYYGADAVSVLARNTRSSGKAADMLVNRPLRNPETARAVYPLLKAGRRLLLWLTGKQPIQRTRRSP